MVPRLSNAYIVDAPAGTVITQIGDARAALSARILDAEEVLISDRILLKLSRD
jgi:hypothetical protein